MSGAVEPGETRAVETGSPARSVDELTEQELLDKLQSMDEYAFEQLIGDLWQEMGWKTTVTTASMDKGIDVVAERDSPFPEKQVIQAKRYSTDNPVGSSEIQQYAGLHAQEDNVDAVIVVTTGRFTSNAEDAARDSNVKLVTGKGLCDMILSTDAEIPINTYQTN